jgi:hypothetical protein
MVGLEALYLINDDGQVSALRWQCRLGHHVCLMNRLGLGASPVTPGYCDIGSLADFERFRSGSS